MSGTYETRLAELGVTLPDAPAPAANYVPYVTVGDMVYVSGQISQDADGRINGKLGDDFTVEQGQAAAKSCAINLMAQLKAACDGDLDRLVQVVKLGGFVNCTPRFRRPPQSHQRRFRFHRRGIWQRRQTRPRGGGIIQPALGRSRRNRRHLSNQMNPLQPFIDGPIAHRTLHDVNAGRPENSYEGLDAAIQARPCRGNRSATVCGRRADGISRLRVGSPDR